MAKLPCCLFLQAGNYAQTLKGSTPSLPIQKTFSLECFTTLLLLPTIDPDIVVILGHSLQKGHDKPLCDSTGCGDEKEKSGQIGTESGSEQENAADQNHSAIEELIARKAPGLKFCADAAKNLQPLHPSQVCAGDTGRKYKSKSEPGADQRMDFQQKEKFQRRDADKSEQQFYKHFFFSPKEILILAQIYPVLNSRKFRHIW